jgi:hypothetical protein
MQPTSISIPAQDRNAEGRLSVNFFKTLIIHYVKQQGYYRPRTFKDFVETLDILSGKDRDKMPTRNYAEWKHNVDAAKQGLLEAGILVPGSVGRFIFPAPKA